MSKEPNNKEILEAINVFSSDNDKQLHSIKNKLQKIENKTNALPTKDYLDEKLMNLRGDLIVLMRKEDTKLKELVKILKDKKVITTDEKKRVLSMEPFPQLSL